MAFELTAHRVGGFRELASWWEHEAPGLPRPFALRDWLETWWECLGAGRDLRLYACSGAGGAVAAAVPLFRDGDGVLRLVGDGLTDELGPVFARTEYAKPALAAALAAELRPGERFVGASLPARAGWEPVVASGRRAVTSVQVESSPVAELAGRSWREYLAGSDARRRRVAARDLDRHLDSGRFEVRQVTTQEELGGAFDRLVALHQ